MNDNAYTGPWQTINLVCERRPDQVTTLLEDWDNERQYYLNDVRLSLEESLRVRDHSRAGFNHGYQGSGPSQLALAVCLKLYPRQVAEVMYHFFKDDYIARIPKEKETFNIAFDVHTDPLSYCNLEPVLDRTYDEQDELTPEKTQEDERIQARNQHLQEQHDKVYQRAIELPGSERYEFNKQADFVSFCFLRILRDYHGMVLVIATDPGDNIDGGQSITNAAEQLATLVCRTYKIGFDELDWTERYVRSSSIHQHQPDRGWKFEETWDRVTFTERAGRLSCPKWQLVDGNEVATILSQLK